MHFHNFLLPIVSPLWLLSWEAILIIIWSLFWMLVALGLIEQHEDDDNFKYSVSLIMIRLNFLNILTIIYSSISFKIYICLLSMHGLLKQTLLIFTDLILPGRMQNMLKYGNISEMNLNWLRDSQVLISSWSLWRCNFSYLNLSYIIWMNLMFQLMCMLWWHLVFSLQHNIRFLQEILQNRKSDFLEWLIIALIGAEILLSVYDIVHRSALNL